MLSGFIVSSSDLTELQELFDSYCSKCGVIEPDRRDAFAHRLIEAYANGLRGPEALTEALEHARLG